MKQATKSIKIKLSDYQTLEELRLESLKAKGIFKNKLEMLHELIQAKKEESSKA